MRPLAAVFAVGVFIALTGAPQAAPVVAPGPSAMPAITLVAGGCGPGFHRRFGRPWNECVPNGYYGPGPGRRCPWGMHFAQWRGPYGHWHARCVPNR